MNKVYTCYPGGRHKALTMSYDDGRTYDRQLVEIFNQYGIKGTFHLNSGFLGDERHIAPEEVKTLYVGHEVSCHTVTHPTIARCPLPEVAQEVLDDRQALEALCGYPVRGLSYPNGSLSKDIEALLPACGIRYSRVVGSSDSFALPENPLRWQATCHHNHRLMELGEQFLGLFKRQYLYLMYVWGHSYEFNDKDNWDKILYEGDTITMRLMVIDQPTFDYLRSLSTGQRNGANPVGNIKGDPCLGYFMAASVTHAETIVFRYADVRDAK